jgi:hypothetical protein
VRERERHGLIVIQLHSGDVLITIKYVGNHEISGKIVHYVYFLSPLYFDGRY